MKTKSGRFAALPPFLLAILLAAAVAIPDGALAGEKEVWRLRNDRGNRFEGRRDVTVKRPDLELVSFVGFYEDYYAQDVELKVQFFLNEEKPVLLVARELEERTQYWMEAKPWISKGAAWNEWGPWRTGDVLQRENIPSSNLGVVVRLEGESEGLAPAFIYYSRPPKSVSTYSVIIRPNAPLLAASYTLSGQDGSELLRGEATVADFPGEPFEIRLDVADVDDGVLRLAIETQIKGRNKAAKREYEFFHKSDLPNERVH